MNAAKAAMEGMQMFSCPFSGKDIIDSRDVIARIKELEDGEEVSRLVELQAKTTNGVLSKDESDELQELEACEEYLELLALRELVEDCEGYSSDWKYGSTLIKESYWEEYVKEMVSDIGDMPREIPGHIVIDWDATAHNVAADYTQVEFDDNTYYIR
jgi:hypothetical protein